MKAKDVLEFRMEFPSGIERELEKSFSEMLRNFELALKFSLAQKLVEEKGLSKKVGEKLAVDVKKGVVKRLGL